MRNRQTDTRPRLNRTPLPPLPIVDWASIGAMAPGRISQSAKGDAPLPTADIVVITWTDSEWSAMDHVFVNSDTLRQPDDTSWQKSWVPYTHKAPANGEYPLWGLYQLVEIESTIAEYGPRRVLLFKSSAHLAYQPWITGLTQMLEQIINEVQPQVIYSIGTAGGVSNAEKLGDTVVTNAGHLRLSKSENVGKVGYNDETIHGSWFPSFAMAPDIEQNLLYPLSRVATHAELTYLVQELHDKCPDAKDLTFDDLVNEPLLPRNLHSPKALDRRGKPLLTTDTFYIASPTDAALYSTLEMDDAVIAHCAKTHDVQFAFVRNISDPLVPTKNGDISSDVRDTWSGLIYETFGLYTSYNGALLTWGMLHSS